MAGTTPLKPGCATLPFFGVQPAIVQTTKDAEGRINGVTEVEGEGEGYLVVKHPWPSMARSCYGSHDRYVSTYFQGTETTDDDDYMAGYYFTGDGARRDADGYYWVTGR